jgi:Na+-driven multidrug efflux pump
LPGVVISSCRVIVVFLPLALLGKALLGLQGIFLATLLSNLLLGAIAWRWLGAQIARAASMAD